MIGLVYDKDGWVCQRICERLLESPGFTANLDEADHLLYVPYYLLALAYDQDRIDKTKRHSALFTHYEEHPEAKRKQAMFRMAWHIADRCWAMSKATLPYLPANKAFELHIPADPQFSKPKIRIGVVGHAQPFDRKNLDVLPQLANIPGLEILFTNGQVPWEKMPHFLTTLDYVLVTGTNEGGPMCVPEAIAMGVPVIAPDTGFAWDYPVIRYSGNTELINLCSKLAPSPARWHAFADRLRELLA